MFNKINICHTSFHQTWLHIKLFCRLWEIGIMRSMVIIEIEGVLGPNGRKEEDALWAQQFEKMSIFLGRYNSKIKGLLSFQLFVPKRGCFFRKL